MQECRIIIGKIIYILIEKIQENAVGIFEEEQWRKIEENLVSVLLEREIEEDKGWLLSS